jgi:hypothetical protein
VSGVHERRERLLPRRLAYDDFELTNLIADIFKLIDQATYISDLADEPSNLVITILFGQED